MDTEKNGVPYSQSGDKQQDEVSFCKNILFISYDLGQQLIPMHLRPVGDWQMSVSRRIELMYFDFYAFIMNEIGTYLNFLT